jgi:hypothetical protein
MKSEKITISEEVLEKARHLEGAAMTTLVNQCYPFVFRHFYYRSITPADAEDLTSGVFEIVR